MGRPGTDLDAWRLLVESEVRSHEIGANLLPFEGGTFAYVRTPEGVLDAAVIRIRPAAIRCELGRWVEELSRGLQSLGAAQARVILDTPSHHLEMMLDKHGFTPRTVEALVAPTRPDILEPEEAGLTEFVGHRFVLESIAGDPGWEALEQLRALASSAAEAHRSVLLDRRRREAGHLHPYLVWHEGHLCASFTAAPSGALLRLGGWAVDTNREEHGLPVATVRVALSLGADSGWTHAGCLVPAGDPWEKPLWQAGFRPAGQMVEWTERAASARPAA